MLNFVGTILWLSNNKQLASPKSILSETLGTKKMAGLRKTFASVLVKSIFFLGSGATKLTAPAISLLCIKESITLI